MNTKSNLIEPPKESPDHGYCPFATTATVVVGQLQSTIQSSGTGQILPVDLKIPCMGPECHLWDVEYRACIFHSITRLRNIDSGIDDHRPAKDGNTSIAEVFSRQLDIVDQQFHLFNGIDYKCSKLVDLVEAISRHLSKD